MNDAVLLHVDKRVDQMIHVEKRRRLGQWLLLDELEEIRFRSVFLNHVAALDLLDLRVELFHVLAAERLGNFDLASPSKHLLDSVEVLTSVDSQLKLAVNLLVAQGLVGGCPGDVLREK
jgi:hypothetical protein